MRLTYILAALVALCIAALAQTSRATKSEDPSAIIQAETAIDKEDYAAAEPLLRKALAQNPDDFRAWFDLGFVLNATGHKQEAIEAYRKSVAANPTVFESNLNLGLVLAQAGDPQAERFLRAATQLKPSAHPDEGLVRAWLSLGRVLAATRPAEALAAYKEAARLRPRDPEPHLAAGITLETQNKLDAAAEEFALASRLDPKSTEALAGLANVYQKLGRFENAEAALRKYLASDPQNAAAHIQLGRVLAAENKPEAAISELATGLRLAPNGAEARRELASLYLSQKNFSQAESEYRFLLKTNPNDPEAHFGLGRALMQQRKFPEAQQELMAAVALKQGLGEAYGDLAIVAAETHNYELTLRALAARARVLPEVPGTYFLRATAYDHLRDAKNAAENYRKFLAAANGKYPEQEWQAKHRLKAIEPVAGGKKSGGNKQ
ncbi:MAG: tetratricopeptide repeat protein [Terriglobales bacterium]